MVRRSNACRLAPEATAAANRESVNLDEAPLGCIYWVAPSVSSGLLIQEPMARQAAFGVSCDRIACDGPQGRRDPVAARWTIERGGSLRSFWRCASWPLDPGPDDDYLTCDNARSVITGSQAFRHQPMSGRVPAPFGYAIVVSSGVSRPVRTSTASTRTVSGLAPG